MPEMRLDHISFLVRDLDAAVEKWRGMLRILDPAQAEGITYGEGVSREGAVIDMGVEAKVIEKAGAWLSYRGDRIGQGRENAKKFLKENPDVFTRIEAEILHKHGITPGQTSATIQAAPESEGPPAKGPIKVVASAEPEHEPKGKRAAAKEPEPEPVKGKQPPVKIAGKVPGRITFRKSAMPCAP